MWCCKLRGFFSGEPFFSNQKKVNPISTRGTDYAHIITTGTPRFSDLPMSLPPSQPPCDADVIFVNCIYVVYSDLIRDVFTSV